MNAAARQSRTLSGAWANFKDVLSRAAGGTTEGLFSGLTKSLVNINDELNKRLTAGRSVSLTDVVRAMDSQLSPSTHAIMNTFQLFTGILQGLAFQFYAIYKAIQYVADTLSLLTGTARSNAWILRQVGRAVSILIVLWTIMKLRILAASLATEGLIIANFALDASITATLYGMYALDAIQNQMAGTTLARLIATQAASVTLWWGMVTATYAQAGALAALRVAIFEIPIVGWLLFAIATLATMYWKWKAFHNAVNDTVMYLYNNPMVAFFTPVIGQVILLIKLLNNLNNIMNRINHFTHHTLGGIANAILPGSGFLTPHAYGGMTGSGLSLVGEHGPEIAQFPRGTRIIPNHQIANVGGMNMKIVVMPQDIYIGKDKIGTVISTAKTDAEARA